MTTCLRCGMKISEFTKTCPNCGYNNRTSPNRKTRTSKTSKKIKQDTKRTSKTTTRTNKTTTKPGKRKKKTRKTKEHNYVHPKEAILLIMT